MQMTAESIDGIVVVTLAEGTLDAETVKAFRQEVQDQIQPGVRMMLDLGNVTFVDSAGLGAILSCLRRLNAAGGDLKLGNISAPVRSMFEMVRMHRVIDIHATREDALRSFAG
ncbi:MAG: anti-anti-sigma factor [Planctomycetes bacterium]|nr:anti-anti-sigma factor [Planctomycetota bacterium]